jgi:hypothetical protein
MDNILHSERVNMDFMTMQARADIDDKVQQKLQQERMEKEHEAMMEQVRMEGEMMERRAMINTKVYFCDCLFFTFISPTDMTSPYCIHYRFRTDKLIFQK